MVIVATAVGVIVAGNELDGLPAFRLKWMDSNPTNQGFTVTAEFWSTTNLANIVTNNRPVLSRWVNRTNVAVRPGSNFVAVPRLDWNEFFIIRNRVQSGTNVMFTDWDMKLLREVEK